ncbi:helix-turn-helix domain-containing protein [Rhizomonospora bruguierae]|uniref:helix-turn-helix domain-containing protein n=1 Tax=Rhizomonospora bruguierae TaxID=1581705 RepID=UPI001BCD46C9|nr:MerR family transcriptional regulator [Micromonospora sp. NBRC 107566]
MRLLRIGEVAASAGVSTRTVDFYTGLGLIAPAGRTGGNYRLYDAAVVERIGAVRQLEAQGVPLEDIARAFANAQNADLAAHLARLDQDVHSLREVAETAGEEIAGLLAAVAARAHTLVTTAIEIATNMPPS